MGCKCGSQVILCNLPVRFDTYKGCSHGCRYCFAQKKRNIGKIERDETVEAMRSFIDITTERVRSSVTQGEVKVYINGEYILNFGDNIVLPERGASPEEYYGDDIGGWRSSEPDSGFVLGLIWHPFDYVYHYSERICKALGITQEEWIEGDYWNREGQIWKATKN